MIRIYRIKKRETGHLSLRPGHCYTSGFSAKSAFLKSCQRKELWTGFRGLIRGAIKRRQSDGFHCVSPILQPAGMVNGRMGGAIKHSFPPDALKSCQACRKDASNRFGRSHQNLLSLQINRGSSRQANEVILSLARLNASRSRPNGSGTG